MCDLLKPNPLSLSTAAMGKKSKRTKPRASGTSESANGVRAHPLPAPPEHASSPAKPTRSLAPPTRCADEVDDALQATDE